ncbi:hypothetical protein BU16DRAFT_564787 [Lophium mytilinum]|uniref:Uncharacterized protein n=1 Tax=Lophium mytilinum TaxID=390894 RepID=A0A6A6QK44_9PEZI|nr:hypothetical protein BU16DRAFT_564787 [Lophium mytilinum]
MSFSKLLPLVLAIVLPAVCQIAIQEIPAFITPALVPAFDLFPHALVRRDCPSGYVTHLGGCCLATVIRDCGNGVTVCTASCPASSTIASAAGSCPSGYLPHLGGCCLATVLKYCGNGITVCTAACPASSTTAVADAGCPSGYLTYLNSCCLAHSILDCGPFGTLCTGQCPATTTAAILSTPSSSIVTPSHQFIPTPTVTSVSRFTSQTTAYSPSGSGIDSSAILSILQTGVPSSVQGNAAAACFLNSDYTSFYATPSWYTVLPVSAQSYFASVNSGNIAACTATKATGFSGGSSSGLTAGDKAGIAIGAIVGASILGLLVWLLIAKTSIFGASNSAAPAPVPASSWNPTGWNGVVGTNPRGWNGVIGQGTGVPPTHPTGQQYFVPAGAAFQENNDPKIAYPPPQHGQYQGHHRPSEVDGRQSHLPEEAHGNPIYEMSSAPYHPGQQVQ